ncbi:calpain-like cysteine peptidase [Trypanosoma grayi]|uniref:calpain-like cysteine peptidase n=1 Tax=Trypanosoma grayi TaxID=71804 RepID=UPI0004F40BD1|nr:calpain-like cysteine peptidase [Trypanosoma grayi]KEG14838.1 calpain-like cysteine peptidase [Trypanosoma grayi]
MPRKALLGNWFEEEAYMRDRQRLMEGRNGGLVDAARETQLIIAKVKHHSTPYPMSPVNEDGLLHFYTPIMLQNAATLGFLSLDLEDRALRPSGWRVVCSTAPASGPTLRNCFVLAPAPTGPTDMIAPPPGEEDVVHYGQPFFIMTVPELCDDPLSLVSEHKGPHSASKVTGKYQDVFFSPDGACAEAMWVADFANQEYREDMRDRPVKADAVLAMRHNHTNIPLASTKSVFYNDFGPEYEVCCNKFVTCATKLRAGHLQDENYWTFVHSEEGKDEEREEMAPESAERVEAGGGNH